MEIAAGSHAHAVEHCDQRLDRRVACARPHARERSVDPHRARLDAGDRVSHPHREVVVRMDTDFRLGL
jgi:hypothetical protein